MSDSQQLRSYAKLNLVLKIFEAPSRGLHPLRSVFQTISLHDTLEISVLPEKKISITTNHPALTRVEDNLLYTLYQDFRDRLPCGFHIRIDKHIPIGGGLGGGSSNAACFLNYLNRTYHFGYSLETLTKLGLRYGSDVPFFLHGGTALVEGVGEIISTWTPGYKGHFVLMNPNIHISTPSVFRAFDAAGLGKPPYDTPTWDQALPIGDNDLASVVFDAYPIYQKLIQKAASLGYQICLSGSGATVFIPVTASESESVYVQMSEAFPEWWCTQVEAVNN